MPTELALYLMCIWQREASIKKGIGVTGNVRLWKQRLTASGRIFQVELDRFWRSSINKIQIQKLFITWLCGAYSGEKPVYLGGAITDNITSCVKVCGGHISSQRLLECFHEAADGRMLIHVIHAVRVKNFRKVIVASPETDVLVNLVYHFTRWIYADLEQRLMISGKNES